MPKNTYFTQKYTYWSKYLFLEDLPQKPWLLIMRLALKSLSVVGASCIRHWEIEIPVNYLAKQHTRTCTWCTHSLRNKIIPLFHIFLPSIRTIDFNTHSNLHQCSMIVFIIILITDILLHTTQHWTCWSSENVARNVYCNNIDLSSKWLWTDTCEK